MCKHILNAQVAIRSPCCRKWFDCAECHLEQESHPLQKSSDMTFACKKCKKCFRKDAAEFEESDEYCPHCDNHFVIEAVTPKPTLQVEGDDVRINSRYATSAATKRRICADDNVECSRTTVCAAIKNGLSSTPKTLQTV
ncbi:CHY zinc finger protein [Aspergillus nidulans FGSC A4]|uniref:CHY-type domain-containing protein n=1 Tax=Emericella nidulans (strain FGSC A4 / ATCC 38163 / CBS 112.46 / NRRL 194 / M139) TaxID=227321 RepID=C8V667_EMENI|nr:hypothetical protein [Aspergillus nidulans FGSC A4]CBF73790.1 TPA: hypothetical protein ANIA_11041 [Aspergillus nidulans FGSC A4]